MKKITFLLLVFALTACEPKPSPKPEELNEWYEPEMMNVEGGAFPMGSTTGIIVEKPVHNVTLSSFKIGKFEVTQAQWVAVMDENPSYFSGDNLPVEQVSWEDIQLYLTKLNKMTGKHYRLPTEAEWEYAARGGNKSHNYEFSGCNTEEDLVSYAWYRENSENTTHPVGAKLPNELGVYDMSGNVWEWCSDWYGAYTSNPQTNPQGANTGTQRIFRGGGWSNIATGSRVACRFALEPDTRLYLVGFRVALTM